MIYTIKALRGLLVAIILISIMHTVPAFNLQSHALRKTNSVSMSITKIPGAGGQIPDDSSMYEPREITVRFINTISGKDVVVKAKEGENLLFLGDKAGVSLPRACRTGLCGSCTCELQDPAAVSSSSNPREGFATIRACSVDCFVPNGMEEMVVDVQRMRKKKEGADSTAALEEETDYSDPLSRFSGDWEREFRPQWESGKLGVGQAGGASDPRLSKRTCPQCGGTGRMLCYACEGTGRVLQASGKYVQCDVCVGLLSVGCGACRGTGLSKRKA